MPIDILSDELDKAVGDRDAAKLREDLELVEGVYPEFSVDSYLDAEVAPVFFGSASTTSACRNFSTASSK